MNLSNILTFNVESVLMLVILLFLVVLMVFSYMKRRKFNTQLQQLRENIKIGDKVMTDTGVVGEVVDVITEGEYKYFTIKTGSGNNIGFLKIHSNAVYYVYNNDTPKYATNASDEDETDNTESVATASVESTSTEKEVETEKVKPKSRRKSTK